MTFTPEIKLELADDRGEIYSITLPDDPELMLLHSKKGTLRGGHSHDVEEIIVMLSGGMIYHKGFGDFRGSMSTTLKEGDVSRNKLGQPHMGEFLEDTWLIEYKMGTHRRASVTTDYEPYRSQVLGTV